MSTNRESDHLVEELGRLPRVERAEIIEGAVPPSPAATQGEPGLTEHGGAARATCPSLFDRRRDQSARPDRLLMSGEEATLTDLKIATASLEDVFIKLTGRSLR